MPVSVITIRRNKLSTLYSRNAMIVTAPRDVNFIELKNLIMSSGKSIPAMESKTISGKRISAFEPETDNKTDSRGGSLTCRNQQLQRKLQPQENVVYLMTGENVDISFLSINCEKSDSEASLNINGVEFAMHDDGQEGDELANNGVFTYTFIAEEAGVFKVKFPNNETPTAITSTHQSNRKKSEAAMIKKQIQKIPIEKSNTKVVQKVFVYDIYFVRICLMILIY